ncbi:hypothetical protein UlMin_028677 [Ulmus minor]
MPPHSPKMVASIVKRLKDSDSVVRDADSVVRDACLETVGIMASKSRSALSILHRMLIRTSKLLKNPHFMAKPTVIQLNTRGGPTQNVLSSAMSGIRECLKSNDWTTWKAASIALGEIASGGGSFLGPFKAYYIQSLESHRFNKVKPVRDTVLQALHCWKTLPGHDTSEPSEAGSSLKENYSGGDYSDLTSESGRKDVLRRMFPWLLQIANEMMCIRKQLLQIEDRQSNLVDLLQVNTQQIITIFLVIIICFSPGIMENLSMLQSRVVCFENVVDRLSQDISQKEDHQGYSVNSPRLSTCTPGPSIVICNRQSSLLSMKNTDNCEDNMWCNTKAKITGKDTGSARMDVLSTLAFYLLEQRFINSTVPWLQQVVELGTTHGPNYLVLSTKARQTLLSAVLEDVNVDFLDPLEKIFVNQITVKLHHICLHWK